MWPEALTPYRRTTEFTAATIPAGLLRAHATKPGTWARLHVLSGLLMFRDLETGRDHLIGPGIHPLIRPEARHEVAPQGAVRFFVEFCALPQPAPKAPGV